MERRLLFASAAVLDPSFGSGGVTDLNVDKENGLPISSVTRLFTAVDGSIVAVNFPQTETSFSVQTYTSSGIIETTSDVTALPALMPLLYPDPSMDAQGRILIPSQDGGVLARYNTNGSLDTTFGDDGLADSVFPASTDAITTADANVSIGTGNYLNPSILVQPNGDILVTATEPGRVPSLASIFTLDRFLPNGNPDPSFGDGGEVAAPTYPGPIALLPDGKILVAGEDLIPESSPSLIVYRYNVDGSLDNTFGSNGAVSIPVSNIRSSISQIVVDASGNILVLAQTFDQAFLVRLTPSGSVDTTFGGGLPIVFNTSDSGAMAIAPNGDVMVASNDMGQRITIHALTDQGTPDPAFGTNGITVVGIGATDTIDSLAVLPDGQCLVATDIHLYSDGPQPALVLFTADGGTPDLTPPTATAIIAATVGQTTGTITVTYTDTNAVSAESIPLASVVFENDALPAGSVMNSSSLATLVSISPTTDSPSIVATYTFQAPGGAWTMADSATDVVSITGIADTNGNLLDAYLNVPVTVMPLPGTPAPDPLSLSQTISGSNNVIGGKKSVAILELSNTSTSTVAGSMKLELTLSPASSPTHTIAVLATATISINLRRSRSKMTKLHFVYPLNLANAVYEMLAVATPISASLPFQPTLPATVNVNYEAPQIDLSIGSANSLGNFRAGSHASLNVYLTNNGNITAIGPVVFQLSLSPTTSATSTTIATLRRDISLAPSASRLIYLPILLSTALAAGNYKLSVILTPSSLLGDTDMTDKSTILSLTLD